tara:strand:- start:303 stop:1181 length:879 start_codon:yes stop_codon:yes gene_type:complete
MAGMGAGGGPDSAGPGGMGAGGGNVNGGGGGPTGGFGNPGASGPPGRNYGGGPDDADVGEAIGGALEANLGVRSKGVRGTGVTGLLGSGFEEGSFSPNMSHPSRDPAIGRHNFDPSAAPVGVNTEATQNFEPAPDVPRGPPRAPQTKTPLGQARDFRETISSFLGSVKGKSKKSQEFEVKAFLDNEENQRNLRNLSIDYANNIDEAMGWGKYAPGLGTLHGMRNVTMKGLRAMGLEPGINTPEMDALQSLAESLGVSIDSRNEHNDIIAECNNRAGYRWNPETKTCEQIAQQ